MNDIDALLRRSFAEVGDPVDDGFSVKVAHAVTRREAAKKSSAAIRGVFWAAASAATAYGCYALAMSLGLDSLVSVAADQVGAARGALGQAPSSSDLTQGASQLLGAGMLTQFLLVAAALAGGAVAYRTTTQD